MGISLMTQLNNHLAYGHCCHHPRPLLKVKTFAPGTELDPVNLSMKEAKHARSLLSLTSLSPPGPVISPDGLCSGWAASVGAGDIIPIVTAVGIK